MAKSSRKPKRAAAPPSQVARPPSPADIARKRLAAQLCMEAPNLIGVDVTSGGVQCAEEMTERGESARLEFVDVALYIGVSPDLLRPLLAGEGPHGSDRLVALWWTGAWQGRVGSLVSRGDMAPADYCALWQRDVATLHADGMMRSDVVDLIMGGDDFFADRRGYARRQLAETRAKIAALAAQADTNQGDNQ